MTADTYSALLGYLVMGTGNDNNTWGDNANSSVFDVLERSIAGKATHAVTGGTLDLSGSPPPAAASQVVEAVHIFTGILTATQTVIIPNLSKVFWMINSTTGSFGLKVKTTGGTAKTIPRGTTLMWCNGSNVIYRQDQDLVGTYVDRAGGNIPNNAFQCDGSTKLIADYPDLWLEIGTTYGGNGITTFGIPDATTAGQFRRSSTGSVGVGSVQSDTIASHLHAVSIGVSVSGTTGGMSANTTHNHGLSGSTGGQSVTHTHDQQGNGGFTVWSGGGSNTGQTGLLAATSQTGAASVDHSHALSGNTNTSANLDHTHAVTSTGTVAGNTDLQGSTETRPTNISCLMCIRY